MPGPDVSATDERTLVEKLIAMATQDESPNERDNARAMLEARGQWPPPPRPPAPPGMATAPEPQEFGDGIIVVDWGTYQPPAREVIAYEMGPNGPIPLYAATVTTGSSGTASSNTSYHVTRVRAGHAWRRRFGDLGKPS